MIPRSAESLAAAKTKKKTKCKPETFEKKEKVVLKEDNIDKLCKSHELCGKRVSYMHNTYQENKDKKLVEHTGSYQREAIVYAVFKDLAELTCQDNAETVYIPISFLSVII